jgi:hypothetical protein
MTIHIIQPSAEQWEPLVNEIDYDWCDIGFSGEPRLNGVPIARFDIEQVARKE